MSKISIVIIGQNEGASIDKMLASLSEYKEYPRVWVLDRCTDDSFSKLLKANERIVCTAANAEGRQTSTARNLGLAMVDPDSDVLFLDGDRYLVEGDLRSLEQLKSDVGCLSLVNDYRTKEDFDYWYGKVYTKTYSAGIFLKRHAINRVIENHGELFPTSLQKHWGIEDTGLGDILFYNKLTAELVTDIKLNGAFTKRQLDSVLHLIPRLELRKSLNLKD